MGNSLPKINENEICNGIRDGKKFIYVKGKIYDVTCFEHYPPNVDIQSRFLNIRNGRLVLTDSIKDFNHHYPKQQKIWKMFLIGKLEIISKRTILSR
jgi:hypothetical protein